MPLVLSLKGFFTTLCAKIYDAESWKNTRDFGEEKIEKANRSSHDKRARIGCEGKD